MRRQKMVSSTLYCEYCDHPFTIPRRKGKRHEQGHVKHMYCPYCKTVTGFIEGLAHDASLAFWDNWQAEHTTGKGEDKDGSIQCAPEDNL